MLDTVQVKKVYEREKVFHKKNVTVEAATSADVVVVVVGNRLCEWQSLQFCSSFPEEESVLWGCLF